MHEQRILYAVMLAQLVVALSAAMVAAWLQIPGYAQSILWGGFAALTNTALLTWRLLFGDRPALNAQRQLRLMYRSSLERFFVVAVLLMFGLMQLGLAPMPVLLTFIGGQLTLVVILIAMGINK